MSNLSIHRLKKFIIVITSQGTHTQKDNNREFEFKNLAKCSKFETPITVIVDNSVNLCEETGQLSNTGAQRSRVKIQDKQL